jgi:hypothetical protein
MNTKGRFGSVVAGERPLRGGGNISQQQPSASRLDFTNERAFSYAALGSQYHALDPVAKRTGG